MAEKKTTKSSGKTEAVEAEIVNEPKSSSKTRKPESVDPNQGKDISIAGFGVAVASIFTNFFTFGLMAPVGLVLSIIGRIQSSKAGNPNIFALIGIIISGIVMALTLIAFVFLIVLALLANGDGRGDMQYEREWQDGREQQWFENRQ